MVKLVLFDIDGTLVRTGGAGVRAFGKVFEMEFGAREGFERLKFAGRTDRSLVREFFGYHGIEASEGNFRRFFQRYVVWLEHELRHSEGEVCEGVRPFIDLLRCRSPRPVLGLLTGNIRAGAELKLRHFHLWDWFETGGFADDHEERDEIARVALERGSRIAGKQLRGDEVVVVGDTPLDIRCGRAIGARVLAVATGGTSLAELGEHRPDWAMPDLSAASQVLEEASGGEEEDACKS